MTETAPPLPQRGYGVSPSSTRLKSRSGAHQRKDARQFRTKPLMDDFEIWLRTQRSRIPANSRLGEKLSYIAKYMKGLKAFLTAKLRAKCKRSWPSTQLQ